MASGLHAMCAAASSVSESGTGTAKSPATVTRCGQDRGSGNTVAGVSAAAMPTPGPTAVTAAAPVQSTSVAAQFLTIQAFSRRCHLAPVSYSCHFFRTTRICSCDDCACSSYRRAYAWQLAERFRHRDGTHAPAVAADLDREHNMVAVNADVLVRFARAARPAVSLSPAPDCPFGSPRSPRQQLRCAL